MMNKQYTFECALDIQMGAYRLTEGESLKAMSDGLGSFNLYVEWANGSLGHFNANTINKLAGNELIKTSRELECTCTGVFGSNTKCEIHGIERGGE